MKTPLSLLSLLAATQAFALTAPTDLTCEALIDPLAIDSTTPHLAWINTAKKPNDRQSAYQIQIASTRAALDSNAPDVWDSGRVASDASTWIVPAGRALAANERVWWRVRVWDVDGAPTDWSTPARYGIGLLAETDWQAKFIAAPKDKKDPTQQAPLFQTAFTVDALPLEAVLHINSLGYHEAYLNGQRIGDDVLSPANTESGKRSLIVTHDVTKLLKPGENRLVVWLGTGWYNEGLPGVVAGGPFLRAQLDATNAQGARQTLTQTDASWTTRESGYTSTWRRLKLNGDVVDAAKLLPDFTAASLDAVDWAPVVVRAENPAAVASPQMVEPNRIVRRLPAKSLTQMDETTWYVDFGENFSGWVDVAFPQMAEGTEVRISYADRMEKGKPRMNANADSYRASGKPGERFCGKFNYHAFRYVKFSGLPSAPRAEDVTGLEIRTDFAKRGAFRSSDADLNAIHDMVSRTLGVLSLGGNMVDCPHIERLGYGGDGQASARTMQLVANAAPFYLNWLQAWQDCQRDDGSLPYTAPNPNRKAGGGVYWCTFVIESTWLSYVNYGDTRALERNYPMMKRWINYCENRFEDGLLPRLPETWYLGDWATPKWRTDIEPTNEVSVAEVNNCALLAGYQSLAQVARALGKDEDAAAYDKTAARLATTIHAKFYDRAAGTYAQGAQTEMIYPLLVGATAADDQGAVKAKMKELTTTRFDDHLVTGLVGVPVITQWATKEGEAEWFYRLIKQPTSPGFLFMIKRGATTTWEHWEGRRSHIHNCFNGIGSWFYEALAGILADPAAPGFRHVTIAPQLAGDLTWVEATKDTPQGPLAVRWDRSADSFTLTVTIPVGTTATLVPPTGWKAQGLDGASVDATTPITVGTGRHALICTRR